MSQLRARAATATLALVLWTAACQKAVNTPPLSNRPAAANPTPESVESAMSGSRGDTARFGVNIVDVSYAPDRATYDLNRPAYITVISVTDDGITAIAPAIGKSELVGSGERTIGLDRESAAKLDAIQANFRIGRVLPDDASADQVREYNRCLARGRARAAQRRAGRRTIIGYDSTGKAIYGPAPLIDEAGDYDYEASCRIPMSASPEPNAATVRNSPAAAGRYLLIYASDTPIETRDITELVVNESDVRSIAVVVGNKLFGVRGASWSVTFLPW